MEEDNFGYRNLYETMTQLEIATNLGYVEKSEEIENLAVEIRRMLSALMHRFLPQKS